MEGLQVNTLLLFPQKLNKKNHIVVLRKNVVKRYKNLKFLFDFCDFITGYRFWSFHFYFSELSHLSSFNLFFSFIHRHE